MYENNYLIYPHPHHQMSGISLGPHGRQDLDESDLQWVMQCHDCGKQYCEEWSVDACRTCAMPICSECTVAHRDNVECQNNGLLLYRPDLQCDHCEFPLDIGMSHSCECCQGQQCLSTHCVTEIRTTLCCNRDCCKLCARMAQAWEFHPRLFRRIFRRIFRDLSIHEWTSYWMCYQCHPRVHVPVPSYGATRTRRVTIFSMF